MSFVTKEIANIFQMIQFLKISNLLCVCMGEDWNSCHLVNTKVLQPLINSHFVLIRVNYHAINIMDDDLFWKFSQAFISMMVGALPDFTRQGAGFSLFYKNKED